MSRSLSQIVGFRGEAAWVLRYMSPVNPTGTMIYLEVSKTLHLRTDQPVYVIAGHWTVSGRRD